MTPAAFARLALAMAWQNVGTPRPKTRKL